MSRFSLLTFFLVAACVSAQWRPTPESFQAWMAASPETALTGKESVPELKVKFTKRVHAFATDFLKDANDPSGLFSWMEGIVAEEVRSSTTLRALLHSLVLKHNVRPRRLTSNPGGFTPFGFEKFPYFRFIPPMMGRVLPGGGPINWTAPCFQQCSAEASALDNGDIEITFNFQSPSSLMCSDSYLLGTVSGLSPKNFFFRGKHTVTWKVSGAGLSPAALFDLKTRGIRVFRFLDDPIQLVVDLLDTVAMFLEPMTQAMPSPHVEARNVYFMENYAQRPMPKRKIQNVDIDENEIQSGDFFGIIRLDGLDPMLGWAMGSTTGHTTTALRIDGVLHVCESTAKDSYWPVNGIQCTLFPQWISQARAAGFNVVHAPLSPANRARFNATAALAEFRRLNGTNYGYHNMLWGWVDTMKDNYPCLPPNYDVCLEFEHIAVLFGVIDNIVPYISNLIINPGWNKRLGTSGLNTAQCLEEAAKQGQTYGLLPTIVEQDAWNYSTTRWGKPIQGKSMVCCVFVCNMWKAGGLFDDIDDDFNCAELTNSDDYALTLFDTNYTRPQVCVDADPDNQLCQLAGAYSLKLNDYNTRVPYRHMDQTCPSEAPLYSRPAGC